MLRSYRFAAFFIVEAEICYSSTTIGLWHRCLRRQIVYTEVLMSETNNEKRLFVEVKN
jgi:hypothetical protein